MSAFSGHYVALQARISRHPVPMLTLFFLLVGLAAAGAARLQLDLSFRPLFASGADIAEPTEDFEQVFGQSSGAWVTAVLENRSARRGEFIRTAAAMAASAQDVEGISEVLSLTSIRVPLWNRGELSFAQPIPDYLLDPAEEDELGLQYEALLDGTRFVGWLVSEDGTKLQIAARLDLPLDDLAGRRRVIEDFRSSLQSKLAEGTALSFSGVSVVELAYEEAILEDQLVATALTSATLMILLLLTFGNAGLVLLCLAPVSIAIPATLGIMGWLSLPVTIINTAIPAIILVIGVADAVHMLNAWLDARAEGAEPPCATRFMLQSTGKACFFTTVTTMGGFLALTSATLESVGNFGIAVAIGILLAWLSNQLLLPAVLCRIRFRPGRSSLWINGAADSLVARILRQASERPRLIFALAAVFTLASASVIPGLNVDQKFNEELPADHPVSRSQRLLEQEFGGFLGPEISIRRNDGGSMIDVPSRDRLGRFVAAIKNLNDTHHVWSIQDMLPARLETAQAPRALSRLLNAPDTGHLASELASAEGDRLAVIVRIGDVGTERAAAYRHELEALADSVWGKAYDVEIVGQWWLAQHGMRLLLRDMLVSLATAMLIVLPVLWIALRDARLFAAALAANLLPLLLPVAFMAVTGITLRIGTAVVLAVALGVVVDNTLHIIIRLRSALEDSPMEMPDPGLALKGTGRAVVFTTLALVGGFLSMLTNDLLAIRDMGLVAAITIGGAMLADLLFLPAIFVALGGAARRVSARRRMA